MVEWIEQFGFREQLFSWGIKNCYNITARIQDGDDYEPLPSIVLSTPKKPKQLKKGDLFHPPVGFTSDATDTF